VKLLRLLLIASSLLPLSAAFAQSDPAAMQWLQRIYSATQRLSYTGTFLYHHDDQVETSRITRVVGASGPIEKLEILDGMPREIIRSRDQVVCYLPSIMTVRIDKQGDRHPFPLILPDQLKELAESYVVRKGEVERVAGYDCQVIVLEPKDNLRYGQKLCADLATGMLLKAKTFSEKNDMLETFAFTQIRIGGHIDREKVKPRFVAKAKAQDWRVEDSDAAEADLTQAGWTVRSQPPGFRKVTEMTRTLNGASGVGHIVFSDGLAAVSVFIESAAARNAARQPGLSRQGAISVFARQVDSHWVTVVGEAPAESVKLIANAVEHRRP
jgi:sigma-E factor negative regulatory protein RseB